MNYELAYKLQMLPAKVRNDRSLCETTLLKSGWPVDVLGRDLDEALSWAHSHCIVAAQEKARRTRAQKKEKVRGDDALDVMLASAGIDPATIPRRS